MFSVGQKRNIADKVQQILRDTEHPELPVDEIQFKLYVHGRFQWSWADIQNNAAVPIPSVNPWNEAQATPPDPQHGREPKKECKDCVFYHKLVPGNCVSVSACKHQQRVLNKAKPLAQYLDEYIEHEVELNNVCAAVALLYAYDSWRELLEQALDAYQSTENVTIKIERK